MIFLNTAPCAAAKACIGVWRTGSNSAPRAMPANAPNVTGVYGARNVVWPTSGIGRFNTPRNDAQFILAVLPWSVAMPVVV